MFNDQTLLQITRGDQQKVKEILTQFLDQLETHLDNMKSALDDHNIDQLQSLTHQLKSSLDLIDEVLSEKFRKLNHQLKEATTIDASLENELQNAHKDLHQLKLNLNQYVQQ